MKTKTKDIIYSTIETLIFIALLLSGFKIFKFVMITVVLFWLYIASQFTELAPRIGDAVHLFLLSIFIFLICEIYYFFKRRFGLK